MLISSYDGTKLDRAASIMEEALAELKAEVAVVQAQLNSVVPKAMLVKNCNKMGAVYSSVDGYRSRSRYSSSCKWETIVSRARAHAEELIAASKAIHEENIPAIENNTRGREVQRQIAEAFGFPHSYKTYAYKTSRSSKKTATTHNAGWVDDMRFLPVSDGWDAAQRQHADYVKKIDKYERDCIASDKELERAKEAASAKLREDRALAVFIGKYGLDIESAASDVLDNIIEKDKYLRLAHYMMLNRTDWNDGYSLAECGLYGFVSESPRDREIYDDVYECMGENWDGDGRVFRDTEWNYDRIFELADEALMVDYRAVLAMLDDY